MAKIADVFGRYEAFCVSILIYILGYVQMASSTNVQTYASAQIFYSAGSTGLQILQQVFIADSSDLLNRAFLALLPEFPFLITVWLGPTIAGAVLRSASWRWGYGMWAIILPAAFLPLALSLLLNQRKARRLNLIKPSQKKRRRSVFAIVRRTWYDLDVGGLSLLSAAVTLILVPLTLAASAKNGWLNPSIITMMVIGLVCLVIMPFYESNKKLAPKPLLSLHLLKQKTALAGCFLAFWYFSTSTNTKLPQITQLININSGILLLCPTIPLLLPPSCPKLRRRNSRPRHANIRLHLNNCRLQRLHPDKIHSPLPNLRNHWLRNLHDRPNPDANLPDRKRLPRPSPLHANPRRLRRRSPERPRPTRRPSLSQPPRCRRRNSHVPHIDGTRRCRRRGHLRRSLDPFHSAEIAAIPTGRKPIRRRGYLWKSRQSVGIPRWFADSHCYQSQLPGDDGSTTHSRCYCYFAAYPAQSCYGELQAG